MGTKVVIYSNANLESFYEQTLQYLHEKYHSHPTMLDYGEVSPEEAARTSYYDGMGRDAVRHAIKSQRSARAAGLDIDKSSIADLFAAGICNRQGLA